MSLKQSIARKRQRETHYDVVVADPTDAETQLATATRALTRATLANGEDSPEADAARASVDEARAALEACVERIRFHNLPPHEFEALVAAHEPTKDQQAKGDQWNVDTFAPALIAACAVDSDMTEPDWIAELRSDRWSSADRNAIFMSALSANVTARSVTIPKG